MILTAEYEVHLFWAPHSATIDVLLQWVSRRYRSVGAGLKLRMTILSSGIEELAV